MNAAVGEVGKFSMPIFYCDKTSGFVLMDPDLTSLIIWLFRLVFGDIRTASGVFSSSALSIIKSPSF